MEFRKILTLRGPNIWAHFPVIEAWVDLKELKDSPSDELPGFNERLKSWLPTMVEHRCSVGARGGFFERLERGTYQAHILEHVTLELQSLAGNEVGFGRARETNEDGVYKVAIQYREEEVAKAAIHAGRELCLAAVYDRPFDLEAAVKNLRELHQQVALGPSTSAIVQAAKARGIPARRMNSGSLVQLGYGSAQRRILTAETDRTSAIAEGIAQDKELTRTLLKAVGVPVPSGRPVADADDAWGAAEEIGGPVVVKPQYGNHGRGVATNLVGEEQVRAAYAAAAEQGSNVIVERFAPGDDYRVLVVNGQVVAAARREPAQVVGNGRSTILELIEDVNRDPRRSDGHATSLSKIHLDPVALGVLNEQGYRPGSIPTDGARVLIRRNANLSTGGTATDVTDLVHPEVADRVIEAARIVGLDVAGVDVVATDVGRPLEEQAGVVVEVNAGPGLRMHLEPSFGASRPVGEAIVASLFPEGRDGRIPIVGVTGVNGKTTTTRLISHIAAQTGVRVGMTCTDGLFIRGRRIDVGDCSGPKSARTVLLNPGVDLAVLETARGGILREGLGFDLCDVAVVTNIGEGDHLGLAGIETPEELARVKGTLVESVAPDGMGVLNAADPLVSEMVKKCPGSVTYFALDAGNAIIASHRERGGKAVFVRDGLVVLAEGARETPLVALSKIPLTHGGRIAFQAENSIAAAAAAWALGVPRELIRSGLESFLGDVNQTPGRFNVLHAHGATVILDYGHNPSAVAALIEAVKHFPHERRVMAFSAAGDRRDVDIIRQGELIGETFDRVVFFEDQCNRGREDGEIIALLRRGFTPDARVSEVIETRGELNAVEIVLRDLRAGDLIVIQPDMIETTLAFVQHYLASGPPVGVVEQAEPEAETIEVQEFPASPVFAAQLID